jgi:hypothetical protein
LTFYNNPLKKSDFVTLTMFLTCFADADTKPDPSYRKGMELNWDHIKKFFRAHVKQYVLDLEVARKKRAPLRLIKCSYHLTKISIGKLPEFSTP